LLPEPDGEMLRANGVPERPELAVEMQEHLLVFW
jgi:hypothetical protein